MQRATGSLDVELGACGGRHLASRPSTVALRPRSRPLWRNWAASSYLFRPSSNPVVGSGMAKPARAPASRQTDAKIFLAAFRCGMSTILPSTPKAPTPGLASNAATILRACSISAEEGA
jgi:hypothetical protein